MNPQSAVSADDPRKAAGPRGRSKAGAAACLILLAHALNATEPCPPSPCLTRGVPTLDRAAREKASDWIAVGTIDRVRHQREGEPLNKDFASFRFHPARWEKGTPVPSDGIAFTVGWCANAQELPADTSGPFRFYGVNAPNPEVRDSAQYLYFERVPEAPPSAEPAAGGDDPSRPKGVKP